MENNLVNGQTRTSALHTYTVKFWTGSEKRVRAHSIYLAARHIYTNAHLQAWSTIDEDEPGFGDLTMYVYNEYGDQCAVIHESVV
jgi:hypothetical protein